MKRVTIDFGIDLGTTNSEIAVFNRGQVEVVKNIENAESTASAVWISDKGRTFVGRQARERHEFDSENARIEFKRQMGRNERILFPASGRTLLPEELSAEVLKQLKLNVLEHLGEEVTASVITVPADFNAAQTEATMKAAKLAGLAVSPLIQEPVAAAIAYGFDEQSDGDRARWLVYDFGGGTFDACLIRKADGMIRIENHGGDKCLGGKDIDQAIVDDLFVPALLKRQALPGFKRDNARWREAYARLKISAEQAKIRLSRTQSEIIDIPELCRDEQDKVIAFDFELTRTALEQLAEPMIAKSINICRGVLREARLTPADIEKVILVGGPTLMPYLRQRLSDKETGLGIPLEFRVDPFTVVSRGAAIFAATQPLQVIHEAKVGEYQVRLDYKAIGPDVEPLVSGQVVGAGAVDFSRFTIELINREVRPPWRSGRLGLSPEGGFMASLWAEKGRQNIFEIELVDDSGRRQKTEPEAFPYTVGGGGITAQPLIHSIGIGLADNTMSFFFEKGTPLPTRKRMVLYTTQAVKRGSHDELIKAPVMEGEEKRSNRNERVGTLLIRGTQIQRDLPVGSEIEITLEVDESRQYTVRAYLPILDEEFEARFNKETVVPRLEELQKMVASEKKRLAELREKTRKTGDGTAASAFQRIDSERLEHDVDSALLAAAGDQDSLDKCFSRLRDLQIALDAVEEALVWPELVAEAEQQIKFAEETVRDHGKSQDRDRLPLLIRGVREAVAQGDPALLAGRADEIRSFWWNIYQETDERWLATFLWLQKEQGKMRDSAAAERAIAAGQRAIDANNIAGVREAARQLRALLPGDMKEPGPFSGESTVSAKH